MNSSKSISRFVFACVAFLAFLSILYTPKLQTAGKDVIVSFEGRVTAFSEQDEAGSSISAPSGVFNLYHDQTNNRLYLFRNTNVVIYDGDTGAKRDEISYPAALYQKYGTHYVYVLGACDGTIWFSTTNSTSAGLLGLSLDTLEWRQWDGVQIAELAFSLPEAANAESLLYLDDDVLYGLWYDAEEDTVFQIERLRMDDWTYSMEPASISLGGNPRTGVFYHGYFYWIDGNHSIYEPGAVTVWRTELVTGSCDIIATYHGNYLDALLARDGDCLAIELKTTEGYQYRLIPLLDMDA